MTIAPSIEDRIGAFLGRFVGGQAIAPDADIFALGVMNSLLAMQFILFLEQSFAVAVPDDDVNIDSIRTPAAAAALVRRLGGG